MLDIVILSEPSIYPLKTGGVPHDDIVVVDVAGFGYEAEKGKELSLSNGKMGFFIIACWLCDSVWVDLVGFPCCIGLAR